MFNSKVRELVELYLERCPQEQERLSPLKKLIADGGDLRSREHLPGHLTASAFIIDRDTDSLLLVFHRGLQRWLQPGGHIEPNETLIQAAFREAREEVGDHPFQRREDSEVPLDIDIHLIPARPLRGEPAHYHHDFRYVFEVCGRDWVKLDPNEVDGHRWIPLHDPSSLPANTDLMGAVEKLRNL